GEVHPRSTVRQRSVVFFVERRRGAVAVFERDAHRAIPVAEAPGRPTEGAAQAKCVAIARADREVARRKQHVDRRPILPASRDGLLRRKRRPPGRTGGGWYH